MVIFWLINLIYFLLPITVGEDLTSWHCHPLLIPNIVILQFSVKSLFSICILFLYKYHEHLNIDVYSDYFLPFYFTEVKNSLFLNILVFLCPYFTTFSGLSLQVSTRSTYRFKVGFQFQFFFLKAVFLLSVLACIAVILRLLFAVILGLSLPFLIVKCLVSWTKCLSLSWAGGVHLSIASSS